MKPRQTWESASQPDFTRRSMPRFAIGEQRWAVMVGLRPTMSEQAAGVMHMENQNIIRSLPCSGAYENPILQ
jgi:hypothetical protein